VDKHAEICFPNLLAVDHASRSRDSQPAGLLELRYGIVRIATESNGKERLPRVRVFSHFRSAFSATIKSTSFVWYLNATSIIPHSAHCVSRWLKIFLESLESAQPTDQTRAYGSWRKWIARWVAPRRENPWEIARLFATDCVICINHSWAAGCRLRLHDAKVG